MQLVFTSLVMALVACSCLGMHNPSWSMSIDEDGEINQAGREIAESLAVQLLATEDNPLVPIPQAAERLGLITLVGLLKRAGLNKSLSGAGNFTLFGPNNEAFYNLPDDEKKALTNVTTLTNVLKFHVLAKAVKSKDLKNDLLAVTLQGQKIRFNIYKRKTMARPEYTAQCARMEFARLDRPASNGVIHVLQGVMIPPAGNVVASLAACPKFKVLVQAVRIARLTRTLKGAGPFTVFAPTDAAFKKLKPEVLQKLLKNPKALANVLKYHVVSGTFCRAGLISGKVKTVQGQNLNLKVTFGGVTVNNAKVVKADGSVTNGVVHAIDTVLLPKSLFKE